MGGYERLPHVVHGVPPELSVVNRFDVLMFTYGDGRRRRVWSQAYELVAVGLDDRGSDRGQGGGIGEARSDASAAD